LLEGLVAVAVAVAVATCGLPSVSAMTEYMDRKGVDADILDEGEVDEGEVDEGEVSMLLASCSYCADAGVVGKCTWCP
jgi:hypothetical protein